MKKVDWNKKAEEIVEWTLVDCDEELVPGDDWDALKLLIKEELQAAYEAGVKSNKGEAR